MKNIKYILVAFACCLFTGCMDEDWDTPDTTDAFGNKNIVETNVVTIKKPERQVHKRYQRLVKLIPGDY